MCKTQKGSFQRDYTHGELAIPFFFGGRGREVIPRWRTIQTQPHRPDPSRPNPDTPPDIQVGRSQGHQLRQRQQLLHLHQRPRRQGGEWRMACRLQSPREGSRVGKERWSQGFRQAQFACRRLPPPAKSKLDELGPFLHSPRKDLRCKELYDRSPF